MSSLFLGSKRASHRQIRAVSQGASVSLVHRAGDYVATFTCATAIAAVLGDRALTIEEQVPTYTIPVEELQAACVKLAQKLSVALVDVGMVNHEVQFVLLWKIDCIGKTLTDSNPKPSVNLDEY